MNFIYNIDELLRAYRSALPPAIGSLISLNGVDGCDGYNPSRAVHYHGRTYFYVRVEPRGDEFAYWSVPFKEQEQHSWEMDRDLPRLHVQDPFVTRIHGKLIVGGVSVLAKTDDSVFFETIFLEGESPATLATFGRGPLNMKDVRLVELSDGRIGVFTRPLGTKGGRGRIGYTEVESLDDVTPKRMAQAELLSTQPVEAQWWGANDAVLLRDGCIGVIGHAAKFNDNNRHYYPIAFVFDPVRRIVVDGPRIIADRSRFPAYPAKRPDLEDVVFPASFDRQSGTLLCGLSDSAVGTLPIDDPFTEYERRAT